MKWIDLKKISEKISLGLLVFVGSCGGFQSASYYSDGIYSSDNVIVVRKSQFQSSPNAVAYSQYFNEKANQYTWDEASDDAVLSNLDSLSATPMSNYKTQPNWGGGNKTTQIIIQNNGWGYNDPLFWGFGNVYDPFGYYWNRPFRFYNRWRWNRFAWGGYSPFYSPFMPYYLNGYYYNHAFGITPFYANPWRTPWYGEHRNRIQPPQNAYSSNYRGRARSTTSARNISGSNRETIASNPTRTNSIQSSQGKTYGRGHVPNLVREGRRVNARRVKIQEQNNRNYIDQVIRSFQNRGYTTQVIENPTSSRAAQGRRIVVPKNVRGATTQSKSTYSNPSRSSSSRSSTSSSRSSYQSSRSSYRPPARSSYSAPRSSSRTSGSSGGSRRRQ